MIVNGTRNYEVIETKKSRTAVISTLIFKRASEKEMGKHECIARNSIGEIATAITLCCKYRISQFPVELEP